MSNSQRPLLKSVASAYEKHKSACHPGLWLDKAAAIPPKQEDSIPDNQKGSKPDLTEVIRLTRAAKTKYVQLYAQLMEDRRSWLERSGAEALFLRASGPLALHLARANALENAGVCLHPVYGFACLPGSGLKGLAHAFACEHWLPTQADKQTAWQEICAVFGWAPSPWLRELAKRHGVEPPENQSAGAILFHDAWPAEWPELILDIVNSHHSQYYGAADNNVPPPGDWENPIPVYFPAIKPGAEFHFPLQPREAFAAERAEEARRLLGLARQWLASGLYHLGAGAKTNAGYGRFEKPAESEAITIHSLSPQTATFECELELVTPAFLAGASQTAEDCDLRPATLRGLLRWWWRTMHSSHLSMKSLRELESALWGSAEQGGALSLFVEPITLIPPSAFKNLRKSPDRFWEVNDQFKKKHNIGNSPKGQTQGFFYTSFGMAEWNSNTKRWQPDRFYIEPGAQWRVRIVAKAIHKQNLRSQEVLSEAISALSLLVAFGGIGAKGRKGYGSLQWKTNRPEMIPTTTQELLKHVYDHAKRFRDQGKASRPENQQNTESASLDSILPVMEIKTPWIDPWFLLDRLGIAYQGFTQDSSLSGYGKHCPAKVALGLPRQIHGPKRTPMKHQNAQTHKPPQILRCPKGDRHPSPFHFHVAKNPDSTLSIGILLFPSSVLPDLESSKKILSELRTHLEKALSEEIKKYPLPGNPPTPPAPITPKSQRSQPTAAPVERDPVEELLKKHPPQRFPASSKGTHQQLIKALESFQKEHPQRITEACQKYRDAIYPNPKEDKSFKKDPLFQFLFQRAPRIV